MAHRALSRDRHSRDQDGSVLVSCFFASFPWPGFNPGFFACVWFFSGSCVCFLGGVCIGCWACAYEFYFE